MDLSVLTDLHWTLALFLLAVSPGICEELFFRGAVLNALKRDLSTIKVVAYQALLFGLVHSSVYRFAPTALLGGLLALVTLRSRSIWPAILLHAAYNAASVIPTLLVGADPQNPKSLLEVFGLFADGSAIAATGCCLVGGFLLLVPSRKSDS